MWRKAKFIFFKPDGVDQRGVMLLVKRFVPVITAKKKRHLEVHHSKISSLLKVDHENDQNLIESCWKTCCLTLLVGRCTRSWSSFLSDPSGKEPHRQHWDRKTAVWKVKVIGQTLRQVNSTPCNQILHVTTEPADYLVEGGANTWQRVWSLTCVTSWGWWFTAMWVHTCS